MASDLENWNVEKWLKRIRMGKYKQAFVDNGYDTPELCSSLSKEDLDAVGVSNKHHRSTLFTQARKLLEIVDKESFLSSCEVVDGDGVKPRAPLAAGSNGKMQKPLARPSSVGEESQDVSSNTKRNRLSLDPSSSTQTDLADYSEPWNGATSTSSTSNTSPTNKSRAVKRVPSSTPSDMDKPSPNHRNVPHKKHPPSPGVTDAPAVKKDSITGMTRLQLKLKIREELFLRNVVLSEKPYCTPVSNKIML